MHHPTDRIAHTTAFVTPVVEHWLEQEIAQWVHPMKDRSDDPSHHEPIEKEKDRSNQKSGILDKSGRFSSMHTLFLEHPHMVQWVTRIETS